MVAAMKTQRGTVVHHPANDGISNVEISGCTNLQVNTQEELDALLELVQQPGFVLPLKPAPGSKPPKR